MAAHKTGDEHSLQRIPVIAVMVSQFFKRLWLKVQITFNRQPQRATNRFQFADAEITKFGFKTNHKSKTNIVSVKFTAIPGPASGRGKELHQRLSSQPSTDRRNSTCLATKRSRKGGEKKAMNRGSSKELG